MITTQIFLSFINLACSLKCYSSTTQQSQNGTIGKVRVERSVTVTVAMGLFSLSMWLFKEGIQRTLDIVDKANGLKANSFAGPQVEFELRECTAGMCGANACDTCTSIYSSLGDDYSCGNFVLAATDGITMTQGGCTMVSDEINQKIVGDAVKKLESQKKQSPEMADQIDQEIEQIKNSKIKKICSCSSDGCNDPQ
jgi:hypothetical protein